jgi:peroxiredoxin
MPIHPDKLKISAGSAFPSLQLSGLDGATIAIPDAGETVHLQLRRFAGCPVCNLHLRSFVRRADELTTAGVREVIVFHSTPESLRVYEPELPFTIVADPTKQIYRALGVESTARAVLDPRLLIRLPKIFLSAIRGIVSPPHRIPPMLPTGGQLGVPADFLIASDGHVVAAKYGQHAYDQWTVDELLTHHSSPRLAA